MSNKRISKAAQLLKQGFPEKIVTNNSQIEKKKAAKPEVKKKQNTGNQKIVIGKKPRSKITMTLDTETIIAFHKLQSQAIENGLKKPSVGELVDVGIRKLLKDTDK